jgi:hypothetical protein
LGFFIDMNLSGIVMGVGAPNETKTGEKSMCAIVLTADLGFIRVYPIPASQKFGVWSNVDLSLEKGNDSRDESWRIIEFKIKDKIESRDEKLEILESCVLKSGTVDPLQYMNESQKSIALVRVEWGSLEATLSQKIPTFVSRDDEECGWIVTQAKHWLKPYITWTSQQGSSHTSHLGGREIYEGIRRNPTEPWTLMNNLQIMNPDYDKYLLLGNMKNRRNVWLCVHLHRLKKQTGGSIPLFSSPIIGKSDGWPYSKQEANNVFIAGNQQELFTMKDMILASTRGNMTPQN